ncbi:hypothetical protein GCM10010286_35400 [Streptomyces toxytricini]|nr:hypothetical protein GCM10010286_35400 [Streptomyces toxytricini]
MTAEDDMPPPHYRDSSHGRNRPTAPPAQDEEDGIRPEPEGPPLARRAFRSSGPLP